MLEDNIPFWRSRYVQLIFGLCGLVVVGCTSSNSSKTISVNDKNAPSKDTTAQKIIRPINYRLVAANDTIEWLRELAPGDTLSALLVLNRVDRSYLLRLDTIVFPDTIGVGIDLYAPFPKSMNEFRDIHKILLISHYTQTFAVYESGVRVRWGPVSLGKQSSPTPTGLFATNWKSKKTTSTVNPDWVMEWYFNLANFEGVSMHQYALPGVPASHACVRLYEEDAYWLYHWADQWVIEDSEIAVYGTPVVIFGSYPFEGRKPWLNMAKNNKAMEITPKELREVTKDFLPTIMERQTKRDSLEL